MKFKELVHILHTHGYFLKRSSKHLIYSNGVISLAVPHQKEVNKILTKHILKQIGVRV